MRLIFCVINCDLYLICFQSQLFFFFTYFFIFFFKQGVTELYMDSFYMHSYFI